MSTGSGTRRNLLPMGIGGRYSNLSIVPPRKAAADASGRGSDDAVSDGSKSGGGGGGGADGAGGVAGTLPPWAAQAGALWSGVVTKAAQGTAALGPLTDRYTAFVSSLRGGRGAGAAAPLSRQEDVDVAEVETRPTRPATVAKVAPQAAPASASARGYSFGLDDNKGAPTTNNVYVGRYSNV